MGKRVKVYSTSTCPYCIRTKQFLNDNSIEFENIDISANADKAQEMIKISSQTGVPVLDIEGEIIVGFDREKISKALGL